MDHKAVLDQARESEARFIDVKFQDLWGMWQHFSMPAKLLTEELFTEGKCLEGSVLRGLQQLSTSCAVVVPDPSTARFDPFAKAKTLSLIGSLADPVTKEPLPRDPRTIALRAENYLKETKLADGVHISTEMEFYVFDDVRFDQNRNSGYYFVDAEEGRLSASREEGLGQGYRQNYKDSYYPAPPADGMADVRQEIVEELLTLGVPVTMEHHESSGSGQGGIDLAAGSLVSQGDNVMWLKYVAKNLSRHLGKAVTFMPKPLAEEAGSSMPVILSLFKGEQNLFAGDLYSGLSQEALWFLGGILKHTPALAAFTNPTTNSYRRFAPGFDTPVNIAYSKRNRGAVAWTTEHGGPKNRKVKYRLPDPSANPYLAFAAILMAGLDGIQSRVEPGTPLDMDLSTLGQEELSKIPMVPGSLEEALGALEEDSGFLMKGDVFTPAVLTAWIEMKMEGEIAGARTRPTPWEFSMYFDC